MAITYARMMRVCYYNNWGIIRLYNNNSLARKVAPMVHNFCIKCDVCESITRIRIQVGWQERHPIVIACGKCGISLSGMFTTDQESLQIGASFENASVELGLPDADFVLECSGEFPTQRMTEGYGIEECAITPFMYWQGVLGGGAKYNEFGSAVCDFIDTCRDWPKYKRVLELSQKGNLEFFTREIKKLYPQDFLQCRNELEVLRASRMIEVPHCLAPLRKDILELPELGTSIMRLNHDQLKQFLDFLNSHPGYTLQDLKKIIFKIMDEFVSVFSYLIPAFSLSFCKPGTIDYSVLGTSTSSYEDVKGFYVDVYEALGNLLIVAVGLDGIRDRGNFNSFLGEGGREQTLENYIGLTKANRFHVCSNTGIYVQTLGIEYDAKLRNAFGHFDVEYDPISQILTYTPNPKDRTKSFTTSLLKYEVEAIKMFQAVLVVSEYLYRLNEMALLLSGVKPLPVNLPERKIKKIGRNEPCPCGSGLKYKRCHGKLL